MNPGSESACRALEEQAKAHAVMFAAMAPGPLTIAAAARLPLHRSFFWDELCRGAGSAERVTDWLIAQANVRGFHGAFVMREEPVAAWLGLEDLIVGLLMPHAELDARVLKLIVRILQSGQLDGPRLAFRARRERADVALAWVLALIPDGERNEAVTAIALGLRPPRDRAVVHFNYDPQRLIRRPVTKEQLWRAKHN